MKIKKESNFQFVKTKKRWVLFYMGLILLLSGLSVISFFCTKNIYKKIKEEKMLRENAVVEIPEIGIKAPILEGTDKNTLSKAVGHFKNTGNIGNGNYCIAGHSSVIYNEYFNNLKNIETGMQIILYDKHKNKFYYAVENIIIVNPNETWILRDFGDNRITIITCTDDGNQRLVVTGKLLTEKIIENKY